MDHHGYGPSTFFRMCSLLLKELSFVFYFACHSSYTLMGFNIYEPGHEKMCLMSYANNKGADQPAHPRSLISAFVIRCLDSIICLDSIAEI